MLSALYPLFLILAQITAALAVIFLVHVKWSHQYWKRRNVPYLEPSFPSGTMRSSLKSGIAIHFKNIYNMAKSKGFKHCGIYFYSKPSYMVLDLDYVKNVMTKDFQYFTDRGTYYNEKNEPLSAHLFAIGGVKWRNLRTKLTPTFTSGKMRMMFQTLVECEKSLEQAVETCYEGKEPVDIKEVFARFTTDVIGSCAFGLECDSFKDQETSFRKYGKKIFERSRLRSILIPFAINYPNLARTLNIRFFDKEVSDFFMKVVKDTVSYRDRDNVKRNDFLQMLMEMRAMDGVDKHDGTSLTIEELAAQCFVFFVAGFETSSTTSNFAMYELSRNQDIQQKVREEIEHVLAKHDGKITYDAVNEMKYLGQVIDETLRIYPAVPFVTRECVKDYSVPDSDVIIEKGTRVFIPIWGIHMDPEYFPEPEKFDPDRFSDENKQDRHPYSHIPFGEGPRICIGMRFGLMQTKIGILSLLRRYKFTVASKTQEPLKLVPTSFIPQVVGDIWLNVEPITRK